jgi:hypothetical protein
MKLIERLAVYGTNAMGYVKRELETVNEIYIPIIYTSEKEMMGGLTGATDVFKKCKELLLDQKIPIFVFNDLEYKFDGEDFNRIFQSYVIEFDFKFPAVFIFINSVPVYSNNAGLVNKCYFLGDVELQKRGEYQLMHYDTNIVITLSKFTLYEYFT